MDANEGTGQGQPHRYRGNELYRVRFRCRVVQPLGYSWRYTLHSSVIYADCSWIVVFVATHLIGGITVAINAWLPVPSILHCLRTVRPDLVFVDEERADLLASVRDELAKDGVGEVCPNVKNSEPLY